MCNAWFYKIYTCYNFVKTWDILKNVSVKYDTKISKFPNLYIYEVHVPFISFNDA